MIWMVKKPLARRRQALVALDKIEEAINHDEWADAREAVERLDGHLSDLEDLDG